MATRKTDWINNFWKAIAHDPVTLRRTWLSVKEIMAPGALDARTKEMLYLAVSTSNQCGYCIASHTAAARKAGMTDAMLAELMAVVGMANETNRLASGYQVEIDEQFKTASSPSKNLKAPLTPAKKLYHGRENDRRARNCTTAETGSQKIREPSVASTAAEKRRHRRCDATKPRIVELPGRRRSDATPSVPCYPW